MSKAPSKSRHNIELGMRGEEAAALFLKRLGMELLERNWVCPAGEADIIAHDGYYIRLVEVKTRIGDGKGFPEESVNKKKRQRYEAIAEHYLRTYDGEDIGITFDIIAILVLGNDRAILKHYRNVLALDCC